MMDCSFHVIYFVKEDRWFWLWKVSAFPLHLQRPNQMLQIAQAQFLSDLY